MQWRYNTDKRESHNDESRKVEQVHATEFTLEEKKLLQVAQNALSQAQKNKQRQLKGNQNKVVSL